MTMRAAVYAAMNPVERPTRVSVAILILIFLSTAIAIVETEATVADAYSSQFRALELLFGLIFAAEYVVRLWSAPEGGETRLRYAASPASILDLAVVIGTLLPIVAPSIIVLRLVRVLRMLRIAKFGRYSKAFQMMTRAIHSRASQLWVTLFITGFFLIISATIMYWIEGDAQPDSFGSIPRAMWWAAVTMTTVGYGDIVPLSPLGKLVGGIVSISGVALIAIPTGILAAAFSNELSAEPSGRLPGSDGDP